MNTTGDAPLEPAAPTGERALGATCEALAPEPVKAHLAATDSLRPVVAPQAIASGAEVGDANLNLGFSLRDRRAGGVVPKRAAPYVRLVGTEGPLPVDRARREAEALAACAGFAPHLVLRLCHLDAPRLVMAMQDRSDHRVWRTALNPGDLHLGTASDLGLSG
ncbi:MAG: hypothetical protein ACYDD0_02890, partial [Candidatus Dormibacteria bacterium]